MLSLFAFALVGVAAMIVALTVATVLSVSRRKRWTPHETPQPDWAPLQREERRQSQLPFVGHDRRQPADDVPADASAEARVDEQRRAA